jgi:hypothetical protein
MAGRLGCRRTSSLLFLVLGRVGLLVIYAGLTDLEVTDMFSRDRARHEQSTGRAANLRHALTIHTTLPLSNEDSLTDDVFD